MQRRLAGATQLYHAFVTSTRSFSPAASQRQRAVSSPVTLLAADTGSFGQGPRQVRAGRGQRAEGESRRGALDEAVRCC